METLSSIINIKRLNLVKESLDKKQALKLDKSLNKLISSLPKDSKKLLTLLSRFDNPKSGQQYLKDYTKGKRDLKIIRNSRDIKPMMDDILKEKIIGFDTEQRPTFKKGESQKSIAIMQIATRSKSYIIQMKHINNIKVLGDIISAPSIIKIGFGLGNDSKQLYKLFKTNVNSFFDLATFIKTTLLSRNSIGAKNAVALFLNKKLQKSKNAALSNWERDHLTPNQIKYASEDATAPLDVFYQMILDYSFIVDKLPTMFNHLTLN